MGLLGPFGVLDSCLVGSLRYLHSAVSALENGLAAPITKLL